MGQINYSIGSVSPPLKRPAGTFCRQIFLSRPTHQKVCFGLKCPSLIRQFPLIFYCLYQFLSDRYRVMFRNGKLSNYSLEVDSSIPIPTITHALLLAMPMCAYRSTKEFARRAMWVSKIIACPKPKCNPKGIP